MNILITSGGTVEKIDSVRSISNFSTGRLGSLIAEEFLRDERVGRIYYICNRAAVRPARRSCLSCEKTEIIYIDSVESVEEAIVKILSSVKIDVIVHCMAISDYRVRAVLDSCGGEIDRSNKIRSCENELTVILERTPKIIGKLKGLSPESILIGFKLLDTVPLETLIEAGYKLLVENKCDFVVANDLSEIAGETHIGYLIDSNKNYSRLRTKREIAGRIVSLINT